MTDKLRCPACGSEKYTQVNEFGTTISRCLSCSELTTEEGIRWLRARNAELAEALKMMLQCSPCLNGCDASDMTCASNVARAALANNGGTT